MDSFTFEILKLSVNQYIETITCENNLNNMLKYKKIRLSNFPSHISENMVKFAYNKTYKIMPTWDTKIGDLEVNNKGVKKLEVKGSIDLLRTPSSFGPDSKWDIIYFVDFNVLGDKKITIYEINLSSNSEEWKNIKVNKKQTFYDQCKEKRRPRISYKLIKEQIDNKFINIIYEGFLEGLNI